MGGARLLSHQSGDRSLLGDTLKMELVALGSVAKGSLNTDIFLMLRADSKMKALSEAANYEDYFAQPQAVDWKALWRDLARAYPRNPQNGNAGFPYELIRAFLLP